MINKHKSNKIKENSNTVRHLNNGTDHRHSKSCCHQSSPARRTMTKQRLLACINDANCLYISAGSWLSLIIIYGEISRCNTDSKTTSLVYSTNIWKWPLGHN